MQAAATYSATLARHSSGVPEAVITWPMSSGTTLDASTTCSWMAGQVSIAPISPAGTASPSDLRRVLTPKGTLVLRSGMGRFGGIDRIFRALALSPFVSQRQVTWVATENHEILDRVGMSVTFIPPGHLKGASGRPDGRVGWYAYWRVGGESLVDEAFRVLDIATTA